MIIRFAVPPLIDSSLARLDPRWRFAALVAITVGVASVRTWQAALLCLGFAGLLAVLARMDWRWYAGRLGLVVGLLALFVLPLPLLSRESYIFTLMIAAKVMALFTLSMVLLVTAPIETTLKAARALWFPGLLVHLLLLTYRYVFLLADELARLRVALRVRGFRNRADLHSYHTVAAATGTLLVRGYERAERVEAAMRCRGFDGEFRSLSNFRTRPVDVGALVLSLILVALILYLDIARWS